MKKIITFVLAIAMIMACAISASAESQVNVSGDHAGDKDGPAYAEYEICGLNYNEGPKYDQDGIGYNAQVEYHAVQGTAQVRGGSEDNNVHAGITGTAGQGKAGVSAGVMLDENGNPTVGAHANLEAVAAEVDVTGGATVSGMEINGTVGGKVGVGAHADFGIEDGKFKAELGVSLGLGVELGVEVDPTNFHMPETGMTQEDIDPYLLGGGGAFGGAFM